MIFVGQDPVLWERRNRVFGIYVIFLLFLGFSDISGTNCVYWVADVDGMVMNQVVAKAGVNFSLHGAWDINPDKPQICVVHEKFINEFYWYQSEGALVHFMDASPRTKFSCCHLQWHEYSKHGCFRKVSYEKWKAEIFKCISIFDSVTKFPHQCRYDHVKQCNHVEILSMVPLQTVGCKPEKPTFKKDRTVQFSENMYQYTDTCDVVKMFNPGKNVKLSFRDEHSKSIIPVCLNEFNESSPAVEDHGVAEKGPELTSKPPLNGPDAVWEEIHKILLFYS